MLVEKKLEGLKKQINLIFQELIDSDSEEFNKEDLKNLKEKIKGKVDLTMKHSKISIDMMNSQNNFMLQGKSIDSKESAKKAAESIIKLNTNDTSSHETVKEVREIPTKTGKKLFKVSVKTFAQGYVQRVFEGKQEDISYAQAILTNIKDFNEKQSADKKVYISKETPRGLKEQFKLMDGFAYKLRKTDLSGNGTKNAKLNTKIVIDTDKMIPQVKVKCITKSRGKNTPQWTKISDLSVISQLLKDEYELLVKKVSEMDYSMKKKKN